MPRRPLKETARPMVQRRLRESLPHNMTEETPLITRIAIRNGLKLGTLELPQRLPQCQHQLPLLQDPEFRQSKWLSFPKKKLPIPVMTAAPPRVAAPLVLVCATISLQMSTLWKPLFIRYSQENQVTGTSLPSNLPYGQNVTIVLFEKSLLYKTNTTKLPATSLHGLPSSCHLFLMHRCVDHVFVHHFHIL